MVMGAGTSPVCASLREVAQMPLIIAREKNGSRCSAADADGVVLIGSFAHSGRRHQVGRCVRRCPQPQRQIASGGIPKPTPSPPAALQCPAKSVRGMFRWGLIAFCRSKRLPCASHSFASEPERTDKAERKRRHLSASASSQKGGIFPPGPPPTVGQSSGGLRLAGSILPICMDNVEP